MLKKFLAKFKSLKSLQNNKSHTDYNDTLFLKYMSKEDYKYLIDKAQTKQNRKKYIYN